MPRSLKTFSITLGLGLCLVSLFVCWIDPGEIWHRTISYASRPLVGDEVWVPPTANFPERDIRLAQMALYTQPDLVVLGSSRAMLIDSKLFRPGIKFQNLGVPGASIEDDIGFWQALKTAGKRPSYVMLILDPWILNRHHGQARWVSLLRPYRTFISDRPLTSGRQLTRVFREARVILRDGLNRLKDTWSWMTFKASVKLAVHPHRRGTPSVYLAPMKPADKSAYRADGAFVYPDSVTAKLPLVEREAKIREFVLTGDVYSLSQWAVEPSAAEDLALLVKDTSKEGTRVLVVVPPYHPLARRLIQERPGYKTILTESRQIFEEATANTPGVYFCNAEESEKIGCQPYEFLDEMHMSYACAEKMVNYCLNQSEGWRGLRKSK